jgi:hypothetical protein
MQRMGDRKMINKLLSDLRDTAQTTVILDTSATTPDSCRQINDALYTGWRGFQQIDVHPFHEGIERLEDLERIIDQSPTIILPEVIKEMNAHLHFMNHQAEYFRRTLNSRQVKERIGERRYGKMKGQLATKLGALEEYRDALYSFIKLSDRHEHRISFDRAGQSHYELLARTFERELGYLRGKLDSGRREVLEKMIHEQKYNPDEVAKGYDGDVSVPFQAYYPLLKQAILHSLDYPERALEDVKDLKHPNSQGIFLNTDRKIIATAYTLTYKDPAIILSNDLGILNVMRRMNKNFMNKAHRERYGLIIPKNFPEFRSADIEIDNSILLTAGQ